MDIIRRIGKRLTKYWIAALLIPLAFAILGWVLPVGSAYSRFQASSTIWLGSYGNSMFNKADNARILLANEPFYKEYFPQLLKKEGDNFPSDVNITILKKTMIQITYTASSRQQAAATVNKIADRFITRDEQAYHEKSELLKAALVRLDDVKKQATDDPALFYQLKSEQLRDRPAQILQRAEAGTSRGSSAFSAKKRAVLGLVFGLTLVIFAAAWPELVREERRQREGE
ncbi:MAG: hypothetical protein ABF820_03595 [Sporolactobacillus sp.]